MSTKFCNNCKQYVNTKRKIGTGTLILAFLTFGCSLIFIPMYRKRCPVCQDTNFSKRDLVVQSTSNVKFGKKSKKEIDRNLN